MQKLPGSLQKPPGSLQNPPGSLPPGSMDSCKGPGILAGEASFPARAWGTFGILAVGRMLAGEAFISVSRGQRGNRLDPAMKTITVASSRDVAKAVAPGIRRLGIKTRSKAKLLGADLSCGKRVVCSAQRARVRGSLPGSAATSSLAPTQPPMCCVLVAVLPFATVLGFMAH